MIDYRLPMRNKVLIAAFSAVGVAGLLIRPIYPKSIFVALFVMSVFFAAYSIFYVCKLFREWNDIPTLQRRLLMMILLSSLGGSLYIIYLTLRLAQ
jgi:hypothetical protein